MIKRPALINFYAIQNELETTLRCYISDEMSHYKQGIQTSPIKSIGLIKRRTYLISFIGYDQDNSVVFKQKKQTDSFGVAQIKLQNKKLKHTIKYFQLYEIGQVEGLSTILGSVYPTIIKDQIIISDFDKTLCETRFSTVKDIFHSLSKPMSEFPALNKSLTLVKDAIENGYEPFILSASPHFYDKAIVDWLYAHKIYTSHIFLKDYRNFFAPGKGLLSLKDIKNQGFYKLYQLVQILSLTGVPKQIILVGDGFEADVLIYLTLYSILIDKKDPWVVWNQVKKNKAFKLNSRQHSLFLSKLYQIKERIKKDQKINIEIHIRCTQETLKAIQSKNYGYKFIDQNLSKVQFYTDSPASTHIDN